MACKSHQCRESRKEYKKRPIFFHYIFCCWPQGTLCFHPGWLASYSGSVGGACINNFTFSSVFLVASCLEILEFDFYFLSKNKHPPALPILLFKNSQTNRRIVSRERSAQCPLSPFFLECPQKRGNVPLVLCALKQIKSSKFSPCRGHTVISSFFSSLLFFHSPSHPFS